MRETPALDEPEVVAEYPLWHAIALLTLLYAAVFSSLAFLR